ncbi:hypothetical protein ACO0R3_001528 [Hanseniaspora guilliermondii]
MILVKILGILLFNIVLISGGTEKEKFTSLVTQDVSKFNDESGKATLSKLFDNFKKNGNGLNTQKLKSLKGVFEFLDMNQEYNSLLKKILTENHFSAFNNILTAKKSDNVKLEFYNGTVNILNEVFNDNNTLCKIDEFVICQNQYFLLLNETHQTNECDYLTHISNCANNLCSKSPLVTDAIGNFTQVCSSSKNQNSFIKKKAKGFIKNFNKESFVKSIKDEFEKFRISGSLDITDNVVESELYYKKDKLEGISSECIIPHFKPSFNLKSCNKKQFYICREIIMAELVLTKVHFCPNCENENAYDTCICKCCVAKELMNMCYKPNCEDEIELSRYNRYIEDTCKIKPIVVIKDGKKRDGMYEATYNDNLEDPNTLEKNLGHESESYDDTLDVEAAIFGDNIAGSINDSNTLKFDSNSEDTSSFETLESSNDLNMEETLTNDADSDSPINLNKIKILAKKESLKNLKTGKRDEHVIKAWEVQYLNNDVEDEIVEDLISHAENVEISDMDILVYTQEDLEILEANGCNPYEVTGECYHEHCCYPPKQPTKTVYEVTTETDMIYSTILRYKLDAKTTTETQLLESTITIQVPATTVVSTKYKKKIVPKFKKTITLTTTQISVSTVTVTTTVSSVTNAANAATVASTNNAMLAEFDSFQRIPNRRPSIPNLIRVFGTGDNGTLKNSSIENNTTLPYDVKIVLAPLSKPDNRYSQNSTFDNANKIISNSNNNTNSNSTSQIAFSSLGKINKSNKAGIVVSFITIMIAFFVTVKNTFESEGVLNESDHVVSDIMQDVSIIEKRGLSKPYEATYENDNEEFSFVKDELSRLSVKSQLELTDDEVIQKLVEEEY